MTLIFSLSIAQISKIFYRIPVKYWMTILVCFQLHKENVVWRINIYWLHRELSLNISKNQVTYMDAYMCFYFRPLTLKMWFFYKRRLVILGKMWKDIALENKSSIPWNERIINCEYIYFFFTNLDIYICSWICLSRLELSCSTPLTSLQKFWEGRVTYLALSTCYSVRNVLMSLLGLEINKQTTISNFLNNIFGEELNLSFKKHSQETNICKVCDLFFQEFFIYFYRTISCCCPGHM